ncbi:hypothetical protein Ais01nite_55190 [Asanoa ishikariensis]|uniref:Uncharacterized protein n=1 Tax=Asanoa ishikariensis TaxID=137265 RepID=A0A1H3TWN9_9ACTN|nr:hypothetical protein [Asanoa ishikariensis]GIF67484.1 hypothetical protein Ais01nite_55190 [Asanoa ishikariensis]SDZ53659.1 hypothetical protein SAMN05421684_6378 [Asanoa ishikariensis]
MDIVVAASKELGLTASEIADRWNSAEANSRVAVARPQESRLEHFPVGDYMDSVLVVLGSVALGVAGNAVYDLIKRIVTPKAAAERLRYTEVVKPDGTRIVEITIADVD